MPGDRRMWPQPRAFLAGEPVVSEHADLRICNLIRSILQQPAHHGPETVALGTTGEMSLPRLPERIRFVDFPRSCNGLHNAVWGRRHAPSLWMCQHFAPMASSAQPPQPPARPLDTIRDCVDSLRYGQTGREIEAMVPGAQLRLSRRLLKGEQPTAIRRHSRRIVGKCSEG
jgi:hypothetical protein